MQKPNIGLQPDSLSGLKSRPFRISPQASHGEGKIHPRLHTVLWPDLVYRHDVPLAFSRTDVSCGHVLLPAGSLFDRAGGAGRGHQAVDNSTVLYLRRTQTIHRLSPLSTLIKN